MAQRSNVGIGFTPIMPTAALNFFGRGSYDNNYPNITRIADAMMTVLPYAVDENGQRIEDAPAVVQALMRPNRRMSVVRFLKSLCVLGLVFPYVPLLVWHREGERLVASPDGLRPDNVAGFTFLEGFECKQDGDGKIYYADVTTGETYDDNTVIRLSFDVNPYAVTEGYSPTLASKKWTTLEDCLADFQVGHFKNGAKPGGIFMISAPTTESFNESVDEMERKMRGAGRNNQTIYVHRHVDAITGQPASSEVEWVPITSNNSELALKDLFGQAERAKDMAFGVPAEIKGYISNSNYASVMTAERIFDKYVVLPKLTQLWSDFTQEMNRITGGLGYALSFDFSVQALNEDEKIGVEKKQVEYDLFKSAVQDGNDPEKVIEAFGLPRELADLKISPTQTEQAEKTGHFLEKALTQVEAETIEKMETALLEALQADVEAYGDDTDEKREKRRAQLRAALLAIALARMSGAGTSEFVRAVAMARVAGVDISTTYQLSDEVVAKYETQLDEFVEHYSDDNYAAIDRAVSRAETLDLPVAEAVAGVAAAEAWRAFRGANSEEHRATMMAQEDGVAAAQKASGGRLIYYKTWNTQTNPCPHCADLSGMRIPVDEPFPGVDDWGEEIAHAHPHCRCYLTFDASVVEKSVKVNCPDCGLFLTEGTSAHIEKMKCNRCKKWHSVEIKNGSSIVKEVKE